MCKPRVWRIAHTIVHVGALLLGTSQLTTCDFSGIFATIQQEVAIKSPSIPGAIYGLVKAGGKLYATNGRLWEKDLNDTKWKPVPFLDGQDKRIDSLAASNTCVFACVSGDGVYKYTAGTTSSQKESNTDKAQAVVQMSDGKVVLQCALGDEKTTPSDADERLLGGGQGYLVTSKGFYTLPGSASCEVISETKDVTCKAEAPILASACDGSNTYILTKDKVYCRYTNGSGSTPTTWCDVEHKVSEPLALAVFKNKGETFLLVGGQQGYGEIKIATASGSSSSSSCVPLTAENVHATTGWGANCSTPEGSAEQYRSTIGRWAVSGIYVIKKGTSGGRKKRSTSTDCERPDLYVAVGDTNDTYTGLWKFDTATNTWNRE
ncbi:putative outer membrane protein [Treponema pallidum subsp. endemicum str. Bosnia A]|uniref:Outer membrane protein n=3 Tax=Treponema pallidum subsp. endemicum TaxID=53436 RepID=A0AAU8RLH8_TREPL|nr:hypothetical protein [Treponema pallidum]AJB40158.1 putative outer membrane protein [Treponema pallidum subsp. endemicum str. Bosnia A]QBC41177.1 putative outer membrane protein [Treponema pallidum subsp. endemicum]QUL05148.1 hypothetical protein KD949_00680 [Treponema pallidum]QUL24448.1 hypothetical protein KEA53_00680 [Treponema pallidum]QUL27343.1 hypothetical protein KEA62_00680 [Treponema pallidum]